MSIEDDLRAKGFRSGDVLVVRVVDALSVIEQSQVEARERIAELETALAECIQRIPYAGSFLYRMLAILDPTEKAAQGPVEGHDGADAEVSK